MKASKDTPSKLYVEAGEYILESTDKGKVAMWEGDEMVDDLKWFKVYSNVQSKRFFLEVDRIGYKIAKNRRIDEIDIQEGNIAFSGDGVNDIYLSFVKDDGSREMVRQVYKVVLEWYDGDLGTINISMHAFWKDNVLELGQTENDFLKSKI